MEAQTFMCGKKAGAVNEFLRRGVRLCCAWMRKTGLGDES